MKNFFSKTEKKNFFFLKKESPIIYSPIQEECEDGYSQMVFFISMVEFFCKFFYLHELYYFLLIPLDIKKVLNSFPL